MRAPVSRSRTHQSMLDKHMPRIHPLILIFYSSFLLFSCENYDDLKPYLQNHANILVKTISAIRKAGNPVQLSTALRTFNGDMNEIINKYREAKKTHPGLKCLFLNPPAPLRNDISRIQDLNTTLRHSLLLSVDHSSDANLRLHLAETISLLDTLNRE